MNSSTDPLNDQTFLRQFEDKTLDPVYFDHLGHIRLAWLYLSDNELEVAIPLICRGIQEYAESLGAHNKFHLTMTDAIVRIIANRIRRMNYRSWHAFQQHNADLVNDFRSVLHRHYSEEKLLSEEARVSLLSPDIKPI